MASASTKVIITCAVTAGIHTPTMSEALPYPEMCSLNMGSMNFGLFPLADRYKQWKFDWEEPYLRSTDDFIFRMYKSN